MAEAKLPVPELMALAKAALERSDTASWIAQIVAEALVAAEVDGHSGHGLRRLATYCPQARSGKVDGHAVPAVDQTARASVRVDAGHGFAFPALHEAIGWLGDNTDDCGIAAAAIYRSHHCGVAGHWVEKLAEKGLVGLMFANTPKAIAPAGGYAPVFGTNPIAFAAPVANKPPLVIDMSLSKVARGRVMAAKQKGEPIPDGWAIDRTGAPTTDPAAALAGSMLPIGDAKGAALALMVELLAGVLTGAKCGHDASSFLDTEGDPPGTGQLLIALSPRALGLEGFDDRLQALSAAILAQAGTRLPGTSRMARREAAQRDGVAVDPALIDAIRAL
jgi:(2R)-3-sulfolactate dehydrogenase (NADP+)